MVMLKITTSRTCNRILPRGVLLLGVPTTQFPSFFCSPCQEAAHLSSPMGILGLSFDCFGVPPPTRSSIFSFLGEVLLQCLGLPQPCWCFPLVHEWKHYSYIRTGIWRTDFPVRIHDKIGVIVILAYHVLCKTQDTEQLGMCISTSFTGPSFTWIFTVRWLGQVCTRSQISCETILLK